MKQLSKIFTIALLAASFSACQKPVTGTNDPGNNAQTSDDKNAIELCSDGTLNCYITESVDSTAIVSVAFEKCVKACLKDITPQCATWDTNPTACTDYADCSDSCDRYSPTGVGNLPPSDIQTLPSGNKKAVRVSITGCFDSMGDNEIHFRGTEFHSDMMDEASNVNYSGWDFFGSLTWKKVKKFIKNHTARRIGRNEGCDPDLKNQIKVTLEPVTEQSVVVGATSYVVTPFAKGDKIEKVCKMFHSASCGIPAAIREELDLSQMSWILTGSTTLNPGKFSVVDSIFVGNDISYGDTIVRVNPIRGPLAIKINMVMFALEK